MNRAVWIIVVVALLLGGFYLMRGSDAEESGDAMETTHDGGAMEENELNDDTTMQNEELIIEDIVEGTGDAIANGQTAVVSYIGTFPDGTKFDASADHAGDFQFTLGAGQVIKGWDQGVLGMKVGGKRKLIVPPSLGYGATGAGGVIPPNATLHFEVELLGIQ